MQRIFTLSSSTPCNLMLRCGGFTGLRPCHRPLVRGSCPVKKICQPSYWPSDIAKNVHTTRGVIFRQGSERIWSYKSVDKSQHDIVGFSTKPSTTHFHFWWISTSSKTPRAGRHTRGCVLTWEYVCYKFQNVLRRESQVMAIPVLKPGLFGEFGLPFLNVLNVFVGIFLFDVFLESAFSSMFRPKCYRQNDHTDCGII